MPLSSAIPRSQGRKSQAVGTCLVASSLRLRRLSSPIRRRKLKARFRRSPLMGRSRNERRNLPPKREVRSEATALQLSWQPLTIKELTALVGNREARLVRSGDELLEVIIESLERLEATLQGESPQAIFLWNEKPLRPKDELRLSDYVKAHLERDIRGRGMIANHEVQIRRGTGGDPGEQVDIHVDVIAKDGAALDIVSVIIEVKGGLNEGLRQT